ncbi:MAG: iron transporter [Synergistaceae bacterium]|nr:iron transporter [Synergistaceae bacterium]
MKKAILAVMVVALMASASFAASTRVAAPVTMKPGEAGFEEIPIGETQVGPYNVAAVYFQAVDMYPAGKNPSREDSDMHLEADIHLKPEAAIAYGFGNGEDIWPAYLTVKYEVNKIDGKTVMSGSFMPMNADDGPHYGANIAKGLPVGPYKLKFIIEPPTDYLLHTDPETGVPAKENAKDFFQTYTVEFDWNYTGEQLQNE